MKTVQKLICTMIIAWCVVAGLILTACNNNTPVKTSYKVTVIYNVDEVSVYRGADFSIFVDENVSFKAKKGEEVTINIQTYDPHLVKKDGGVMLGDEVVPRNQETGGLYYTFTMPSRDVVLTIECTDDPDLGEDPDVLSSGGQNGNGKDDPKNPNKKPDGTVKDIQIFDGGWRKGYVVHYVDTNWDDDSWPNNDGGYGILKDGEGWEGGKALELSFGTVTDWYLLHLSEVTDNPANLPQTPFKLNIHNALSLRIKSDQSLTIGGVGFGWGSPLAVMYSGPDGKGIPVTTTYQQIIIPIPAPRTDAPQDLFNLIGYPAELNGKTLYLDDIRYTTVTPHALASITLASDGGYITHKAPNYTVSTDAFLNTASAKYTVDKGTITLYLGDGNVGLESYYKDITWSIPTAAAETAEIVREGDIDMIKTKKPEGTFGLALGFGGKKSGNMTLKIREPQVPNDNGFPLSVNWATVAGDKSYPSLPLTRPEPVLGMIDDFLYARAVRPMVGGNPPYVENPAPGKNSWDYSLLQEPYWYGSGTDAGDAQCWDFGRPGYSYQDPDPNPPANMQSLCMYYDVMEVGEWMGFGRDGLCYDISRFTTISFYASSAVTEDSPTVVPNLEDTFTFSLGSPAKKKGVPVKFKTSTGWTGNRENAVFIGQKITINLSEFSSRGVDLTEITSYAFMVNGPSETGGSLYITGGILCE